MDKLREKRSQKAKQGIGPLISEMKVNNKEAFFWLCTYFGFKDRRLLLSRDFQLSYVMYDKHVFRVYPYYKWYVSVKLNDEMSVKLNLVSIQRENEVNVGVG